MKLIKIFAAALAIFALTACSDDDSWNSASDVKVQMEYPSIEVKENQSLINVPVVLTGDANGDVQVKIKVEEKTADPAMDDVHYLITSKVLNFPVGTKKVNIEIFLVDNPAPDPDRTFEISIESVSGATVGNQPNTVVVIVDKGTSPTRSQLLSGTWTMNAVSYWDGPMRYPLEISENENGDIVFSGFVGDPSCVLIAKYIYDDEIYSGYMTVDAGAKVGGPFQFSDGSILTLYEGVFTGSGVSMNGTMTGNWNTDFSAIVFDKGIGISLFDTAGNSAGFYDIYTDWELVYAPAK